MLTKLANIARVIQLVERGNLPGGLPYVIARQFGSLLAINNNTSAKLTICVIQGAASIIHCLACLTSPVVHRHISLGKLVYCGGDQSTVLIDCGTAVVAPTGRFSAAGPHSIPSTGTCLAQTISMLEGEEYTWSSELESLM